MPFLPDQITELLSIQGSVSEEEMLHLRQLAAEVRDGCIVEVGSFRGRATAALAMGSLAGHQVPVYAVDPQEEFIGVYGGVFGPEDRGFFFEAMLRFQVYSIVRLINLSSEWLSRNWPHPVRLLWIDGDHRFEGVRRDLECWLPKLHDDASIVFDDALDPAVGPYRVIQQLLTSHEWQHGPVIGKTVTLIRGRGSGS
jgi:hypothetical protein